MTPTEALEALAERMGIADNYRVTVTPRVNDYDRPIYKQEQYYRGCFCGSGWSHYDYHYRVCVCKSLYGTRTTFKGYEQRDGEPYVTFDTHGLIADLEIVSTETTINDATRRLTPPTPTERKMRPQKGARK